MLSHPRWITIIKTAMVGFLCQISSFSNAQKVFEHGRLRVSADNMRFQYTDGTAFFWLGDTGWELLQQLTLPEIDDYFSDRVAKGFNLIQIVAIGDLGNHAKTNRYGEISFPDGNPLHPNNNYFQLLDSVVQLAFEKKLFIGLLPVWGDKVSSDDGSKPIIDGTNAYAYGKWISERYQGWGNIIWILGGDHAVVRNNVDYTPVWREMANGIKAACPDCLLTYHPNGYRSSSEWLQNEEWMDFNMIQSSHGERDAPTWKFVKKDLSLKPIKPTLDGEPNYEDHPVNPWPQWKVSNGYFRDYDVRKQLYRSVFAGAAGVTYGHHAIWQFVNERDPVINFADRGWRNALNRPGATQAGYLRKLIQSRPAERIADESLVIGGLGNDSLHIESMRGADGSYEMFYLPVGGTISIHPGPLVGRMITVTWFDPVNGKSGTSQNMKALNKLIFSAPQSSSHRDWVLVIDASDMHYPPPGSK